VIDNIKELTIIRKVSNINTFDVLMCLSNAIDLVSPAVSGHHIRVSYIAFKIAKQLGLNKQQIDRLVIASCIHDIGSISSEERNDILKSNYKSDGMHEEVGYYYTKESKMFSSVSDLIRYHHKEWNYGVEDNIKVPIESQIMHLADRIDAYIDKDKAILQQVNGIIDILNKRSGKYFHPKHVEAFKVIAANESFWLYLVSNNLPNLLKKDAKLPKTKLNIEDYCDLAKWFSHFIDFRSEFTSMHSIGVAQSARIIAEEMKLLPLEVVLIEISGFLHDIGKLAVSNSILEKNGKLDDIEYSIIKTHSFHTYNILKNVKEFNKIIKYASYHHEHIDGTGYPFHIKGKNMLVGSRILSVADILTAISEDRPYRKGMSKEEIIKLLEEKGDDKYLDSEIVKIAIDNIDKIREKISEVQKQKKIDVDEFWGKMKKIV